GHQDEGCRYGRHQRRTYWHLPAHPGFVKYPFVNTVADPQISFAIGLDRSGEAKRSVDRGRRHVLHGLAAQDLAVDSQDASQVTGGLRQAIRDKFEIVLLLAGAGGKERILDEGIHQGFRGDAVASAFGRFGAEHLSEVRMTVGPVKYSR